MTHSQANIDRAIDSFESDARSYENLACSFDETDQNRAAACREMAVIIRSWKNRPESITRRLRSIGY